MKGVAGLVLSFCDLVEAEGRVLRESVRHTSLSCVLAAVGVLFLAGGLVLLMTATYHVLSALMPAVLVYAVLGTLCIVLAGVFLWSAKRSLPPSSRRAQSTGGASHAAR